MTEHEWLTMDDDLEAAVAAGESFCVRAPLGWRREARERVRAIADKQRRRVLIVTPWRGLLDPVPPDTYADFFYVVVSG